MKTPFTSGRKKMFLLKGIKYKSYNAIKTVCRSSEYDFDKTMLELRGESQQICEIMNQDNPPTCRTNNSHAGTSTHRI